MSDTPRRSDHETLADLTARARAFFSALQGDAETGAVLAGYGYDDEAVTDALALVEAVEKADRTQKAEYAEQFAATREVDRLTEAFRVPYVRHVRLARVVFDRGSLGHDALGLGGRRADGMAELMREARTFYEAAHTNAALRDDLGRMRITPAVAGEQLDRLDALQTALTAQQRETGEAQQATRAKDAEEARLRALLSDASEVAKVALADRPQMRERLGLLER